MTTKNTARDKRSIIGFLATLTLVVCLFASCAKVEQDPPVEPVNNCLAEMCQDRHDSLLGAHAYFIIVHYEGDNYWSNFESVSFWQMVDADMAASVELGCDTTGYFQEILNAGDTLGIGHP